MVQMCDPLFIPTWSLLHEMLVLFFSLSLHLTDYRSRCWVWFTLAQRHFFWSPICRSIFWDGWTVNKQWFIVNVPMALHFPFSWNSKSQQDKPKPKNQIWKMLSMESPSLQYICDLCEPRPLCSQFLLMFLIWPLSFE